jgi:hypothetical protein
LWIRELCKVNVKVKVKLRAFGLSAGGFFLLATILEECLNKRRNPCAAPLAQCVSIAPQTPIIA